MTQGSSEGQGSQNPSQSQTGQPVSSESLVTPALEAKFASVFGGGQKAPTKKPDEQAKKPDATKKTKELSLDARNRATQMAKRKADQRKEFFSDSSEDEEDEDTLAGDSEESAENRAQPLKRGDKPAGSKPPVKQQSKAAASDGDSEGEGTEQPKGEGTETDDETPTLSPTLRHAARRAGFSAEEADEFYAENPEKAEKFFSKMHDSFNEVSARFAQLGSNPGQQPQQQGQPVQRQQQPQQQQQPNPNADPVDQLITAMYGTSLDKLTKDYTPAFVDEVIKKPAAYLQQNVIAPMQRMMAQAQAQQMQSVAREVNGFSKGLEQDYSDLYGTSKARSKEQQSTLQQVYQNADFIRQGAMSKGVNMTVSEALERAHNMVASNYLEEQTRKRIVAQVKKRSGSLTQRPSQRKAGNLDQNGQPKKSIEAATEALAARMAELGIQ